VRSATGGLVPLGTLVEIKEVTGPSLVQRYNMYVSVPLQGNAAPGVSTGDALNDGSDGHRNIARRHTFEWTELAFQEKQTGNTAVLHLRAVGALRLPGAGGSIRKLDAAASRSC
jgi:HAE1 family hydrophobic/amphiphilic exporter-1